MDKDCPGQHWCHLSDNSANCCGRCRISLGWEVKGKSELFGDFLSKVQEARTVGPVGGTVVSLLQISIFKVLCLLVLKDSSHPVEPSENGGQMMLHMMISSRASRFKSTQRFTKALGVLTSARRKPSSDQLSAGQHIALSVNHPFLVGIFPYKPSS